MDKEKVLEIARECGFDVWDLEGETIITKRMTGEYELYGMLSNFAAAVETATREECAKLCEAIADEDEEDFDRREAANSCAEAIRNMGKEG